MRKLLIAALLTAGLMGAMAGTAGADPVNQPLNENNCHGFVLAHIASAEPEGVGNFLGGQEVREFQEVGRAKQDPCPRLGPKT